MAAAFLVAAICSAVLGMFQFGYNTGAMNAPQSEIEKFLKSSFRERYGSDITDDQAGTYFSVAVSAFMVAGMVGALSGGWAAERYGRRGGLLRAQALSVAAAVAMGASKPANSYELLLVGRLLVGLACGLLTGLSPLYVAEISPVRIRGAMGTVNQLAVTTGIFASMALGLRSVLGGESGWPALLAFTALPAAVQVALLLLVAPESPRHLILTEGKVDEGRAALRKLLGKTDVEAEVREIAEEQDKGDDPVQAVGPAQLLADPRFRLALLVCVCLHLSQQLSGMVAIFYYSTAIFEGAGIDCDSSQYATLCVGAIMVGMTLVTVPLMDRLGRRVLHMVGLAGIVVCSILITVALKLADGNEAATCTDDAQDGLQVTGSGIFLIVATLAFVVFFAAGPGSIPWMSAGEMFGQGSRSAATSICVFVNWLGNLAVGLVFPQLQNNLKVYSFVPFLTVICICFVFLFIYFPETKNRSSKDVEALMQTDGAWRKAIGLRSNSILRSLDVGSQH